MSGIDGLFCYPRSLSWCSDVAGMLWVQVSNKVLHRKGICVIVDFLHMGLAMQMVHVSHNPNIFGLCSSGNCEPLNRICG